MKLEVLSATSKPLVSIIIPTRNSEATIETCLKSIRQQTYFNVEIIVVDNYSDDRTRELVKRYGAKVLLKCSERSAARNYGAKHARGELLLFIDSDMELGPTVIEECVKIVLVGYDAVIIPEKTIGQSFWAKVRALERSTYVGDTLFEAPRLFRREVFEKLRGYDEELVGFEDYDLQARLEAHGYKVARTRAFIIHHEGNLRLKEHLLRKHYYVGTGLKYISKHSGRAIKQFCPIRRSYVRHWKLLARYPLYTLGLAVMKACEFMIGVLACLRKTWLSFMGHKVGHAQPKSRPPMYEEVSVLGRKLNEDRLNFLIKLVSELRANIILDVGCGDGFLLSNVPAGLKVGIDLDTKWILTMRGIEFVHADARYLPFKPKSFDVVCACEVLEHIENFKPLVREMKNLAKAGSYLVISVPNDYLRLLGQILLLDLRGIKYTLRGHKHHYLAKNLKKLLGTPLLERNMIYTQILVWRVE